MQKLLMMSSSKVFKTVNKRLSDFYQIKKYKMDSYLFLSNPLSPILLQAHVDTVRSKKEPPLTVYGSRFLFGNGVLGADDRAGVYAILAIAEKFLNSKRLPNILITDDEEIGGIGMRIFCKHTEYKEVEHIKLCLALDRQGCGEYVYYNNISDEVKAYVESFGFHEDYGTFSDCELFTDASQIPSVNLSVGFHNQHTKNERLHMDELELTINRVVSMIKDPIKELYPAKGKVVGKYWGGHGNYGDWGNYSWKDNCIDEKESYKYMEECELCGNFAPLSRANVDGRMYSICSECWEYMQYSADHKKQP
jgi:hypothetical protein